MNGIMNMFNPKNELVQQDEQVDTRFLRSDERLFETQEHSMPLVIEAKTHKDLNFLIQWLSTHEQDLQHYLAHYGAVLFRGFAINSDQDFEHTMLKIPFFKPIADAFMAENGRITVDGLRYVLHTNAVYKTGGTLYLGGFHTENYYSPDVPSYITFYCKKPAHLGGETGLINTTQLFQKLSPALKQKLTEKAFFVAKWSLTECMERYQLSEEELLKLCSHYGLPVLGEGAARFVLMYKPSVFEHPITGKKALQLNLFELPTLNDALRKRFVANYNGDAWFWHRIFWRMPAGLFNLLEFSAVLSIAFVHSPKHSLQILKNKMVSWYQARKVESIQAERVGSIFSEDEVQELASLMQQNYSGFLWQQGDLLLVDNKQVMHAGMPGSGERCIRAMVGNTIQMSYSALQKGELLATESELQSMGEAVRTHKKSES